MAAVIAIAAIVGLAWALVFMVRGSLVVGSLLVLILGACFGHAFLRIEMGPMPLTLDRLALVLLLAAYLVQRHLGRTDPKPLQTADVLLLSLVALIVVSGTAIGWKGTPAEPWTAVWRLLGGYLVPLALYWVVRQAPLGSRQLGLVYATLTALGVYLGVTGIFEVTGQWWAVFPPHIADPQLGIHFGRARGPMVHAVSFGVYVATCLLAAWLFRARFALRGQFFLTLLIPLILAGVVLSFTRSVWIGGGLGIATVLALTLPSRGRVLVLGGMASVAILVAATRMESIVTFQREDSAADSRRSVGMRGSLAYVSGKMFADRPLLGFGFGQFPMAKLPYLDDRSTTLPLELIRTYSHHNTFLSILTEMGLVGLALFLGLLAAWGRTAWRLARSPAAPDWVRGQGILMLGVLAIYVVQGMFHELSYTPIDNSLVFFLAGLTVGLRPQAEQHPALPSGSSNELARPAPVLLPH